MRSALSALWRNLGFVCTAAVLIYCVIHAFDPPRLNWGDSGSDYNVMMSGLNFQKYGFLRLRLTPFLIDPAYMTPADRVFIYTHYPQLPDLMNGVYRTVFHLSDLVQFRFIALAFSFGSLVFVYALLSHYWSRSTAQVALALWVVNPLWIQHADYLHHSPYGAFFGFGCIWLLLRYFRDEMNPWNLLASGAFLFLTFLSSYDYWFYTPVLLAIVTVAHYRGTVRTPAVRVLAILAAFAAGAVAFKIATNVWALGGVQGFLRDLRFQFAERATDTVTHSSYQSGVWPTLYGRVERFFTVLLFPVAVFWAAFPLIQWRWRRRLPANLRGLANPGLLLLPALPFLILFREIWVGQYYPALLVVPFYAVAFAVVIDVLIAMPRRSVRVAGLVLLVGLLANSLDEDVRFKKAFLTTATIRTLKAQLDSVSFPGEQILVNHVFDSPYRYYFNRRIVALILFPPDIAQRVIAADANPATHPQSATSAGAIFVQHKRLTEQLFDKGYYYILGRSRLWTLWGNPVKYRAVIDSLVNERDSALTANVARVGRKLYETDAYVVWRIKPSVVTSSDVETRAPFPRN
jgi:hypothetical protein